MEISIRTNLKEFSRGMTMLIEKQLPFATATALTSLAKIVQRGEQAAMQSVFDRPTPFTLGSVKVKPARKDNLEAVVFVQDIAASYLAPFEFGGDHKLIGRGKTWLNPKDKAMLNQYGNLSKSKLAQLKARSDIFVGTVKTKDGKGITGVWQRPHAKTLKAGRAGGGARGSARMMNTSGHLKLLVRFGDAMPVKQHLNYRDRAEALISANFNFEMGAALAKALASAR